MKYYSCKVQYNVGEILHLVWITPLSVTYLPHTPGEARKEIPVHTTQD